MPAQLNRGIEPLVRECHAHAPTVRAVPAPMLVDEIVECNSQGKTPRVGLHTPFWGRSSTDQHGAFASPTSRLSSYNSSARMVQGSTLALRRCETFYTMRRCQLMQ